MNLNGLIMTVGNPQRPFCSAADKALPRAVATRVESKIVLKNT